jgi:hypothetical protein
MIPWKWLGSVAPGKKMTFQNPPEWSLIHKKINRHVQVVVNAEEMLFTAVDVDGKVFDRRSLPSKGQPR